MCTHVSAVSAARKGTEGEHQQVQGIDYLGSFLVLLLIEGCKISGGAGGYGALHGGRVKASE